MISKQDLKMIVRILEEELDEKRHIAYEYVNDEVQKELDNHPHYKHSDALDVVMQNYTVHDFIASFSGELTKSYYKPKYSYSRDGLDTKEIGVPEFTYYTIPDLNTHPMYEEYQQAWLEMYNLNEDTKDIRIKIEKKKALKNAEIQKLYLAEKLKIREFLKNVLTDDRPEEIPTIEIKIEW